MPENSPGSRDTNPNTASDVSEQIPHSGVHNDEKPAYGFEKSLEQALRDGDLHVEIDENGRRILVPNSLGEHRDPTNSPTTEAYEPLGPVTKEEKPKNTKKWIAGIVGTTVLAGAGLFGYNAATDKDASEAVPTAPAEPNAEAPTGPTIEQQQREGLRYFLDYRMFISQEYYDDMETYFGQEVPPELVDREVAKEVVQGALDNIAIVAETGDTDALLAAYADTELNQDDIKEARDWHEALVPLHEQDPSFPLVSLKLASLKSVTPHQFDPKFATVEVLVTKSDFSESIAGEAPVAKITEENWTMDLELRTIEGWSDGGERTTWVISDRVVHDVTDVTH